MPVVSATDHGSDAEAITSMGTYIRNQRYKLHHAVQLVTRALARSDALVEKTKMFCSGRPSATSRLGDSDAQWLSPNVLRFLASRWIVFN